MTRYTATISHHSIGRARVEQVGNTLAGAKRKATQEFGDGFNDHLITIYDTLEQRTVANRRCGDKRWSE